MAAATGDRFDVFVGNVRDSTTEEQLQSVFSVVGKIHLVILLAILLHPQYLSTF